MSKNILYGQEIREKMLEGICKIYNTVKVVLGPKGRDVLLMQESGQPMIVRDGAEIVRTLDLEDTYENLGAQVVKEAACKTKELVGDGTAISMVLAAEILKEGMKNIAAGANAVELKKGIQGAVQLSCAAIHKLSHPVKNHEDIQKVCAVSAESETAGELVAQAVSRVGAEGTISVEETLNTETTLEITEGMQYEKGYLHAQLLKEPESKSEELDHPYILVTDEEISNAQELLPLLEQVHTAGRPLLIIAENITGSALSLLIMNKRQGIVNVNAVHPPAYGDGRRERMQDICIFTGGTFITKQMGHQVQDVRLEMLGEAEKIFVNKNNTAIIEGKGDPDIIQKHLAGLRKMIASEEYDFKKSRMEERLAKFTGGTAVIKAGAQTETEMREWKYRLENAVRSAKSAMTEGVVPGGGTTYLDLLPAVRAYIKTLKEDRRIGAEIVMKALEEPARQIVANAGLDATVVISRIKELPKGIGYDVNKNQYIDMIEAEILDPAKTVCMALQCAASAAATLLTAEAGIVSKNDYEE